MTTEPERIHGWQHSQLSVARFYGGIDFNGHTYLVAPDEPGQPLVRKDVLAREARERKAADKAQRIASKKAQGALL